MIEAIIKFLSTLSFFTIINPDAAGVHLRCGRVHKVVGEGFHWQYPVLDEIQTIITSQQAIDLPNQTLTTRDGKTVNLSGTVRYEVVNPEYTLYNVADYDICLQTLAMEVIGEVVPRVDHTACAQQLKERVQEQLEKETSPWGIGIIAVGITDNAETIPLRIYQ